jgi:hypothetical protein
VVLAPIDARALVAPALARARLQGTVLDGGHDMTVIDLVA